MSTLPAHGSLVAPRISTPAATRRLPRLAGWMLTAAAAGALWYGLVEIVRLAL